MGSLSLRPDYGTSDAALPRGEENSPSAKRVAEKFAKAEVVAPSAESNFWDNPQKFEVRQFAETKAVSNDPSVSDKAVRKDSLPSEMKIRTEKTPPTPSEIKKESPGSENFSTLSRFVKETEQPTPSIPSGKTPDNKHPEAEEREDDMESLNPRMASWLLEIMGRN